MRLALISDIHGNLPALDAVLADIAERRVDSTFHLGDLVGYAPWPNEVVRRIRDLGIAGVAGNYDSTVAGRYKHCGCRYEDATQEAESHLSFQWTLEHTDEESRAFLGTLPFRLDSRPGGGHLPVASLILVHGTPTLNTVYWTADRSDDFCLQMAGLAGARAGDVIGFGHTHLPWTREVGGIHLINTGSVGRPKDGDWRAGYVLLTMEPGVVASEVVRVEYDLDRAVQGILASTLPHSFAGFLQRGGSPIPG
jgi:predicted phosphodiesterase